MKILIPMAGRGKRFNEYLPTKPLIEIESKPMIEHIVDYLPKEVEFIFLCNKSNLEKTNMGEVLRKISPSCKIIGVSEEYLMGPAYTCVTAFDYIGDEEEVIVNYCDFVQEWDYNEFLKEIKEKRPHGAIISFKDFNPASLGDTYYAYMRVNQNNFVEEIREKKSFSEDKTKDFASTGTYYFASGKIFKEYVKKLISNQENAINGEFYISLLYNFMIKDGLKVLNHSVKKFICLGTPRDYELYKFWSEFFLKFSSSALNFDHIDLNITNIIPLAGGERDFKPVGFDGLNFMLPIMGKPLIEHSFKSKPKGVKNIIIALKEHENEFKNLQFLKKNNTEFVFIDQKKAGNAETINEVKDKIDLSNPVCVSGATNIIDYNEKKLIYLMEKKDVDIILFSFSHHESVLRNPNDFAYAKLKNNIEVEEIIEKKVISDNPYLDHALAGTTIFKYAKDLFEAIELEFKKTIDRKSFYLSCLNNILNKRKAVIFEVDKFIPIRIPINYLEFKYWEDYFDKLKHHPFKKVG